MNAAIIVVVLFILLILGLFTRALLNGIHTMNENEFRQARVRVSFANQTIRIKGKEYAVSQVRSLGYESRRDRAFYQAMGRAQALIQIDALGEPVYKIPFLTARAAKTFIARLRTAIEKAGGSRFW